MMPTRESALLSYWQKLRLFGRDVRLHLIGGALMGLSWAAMGLGGAHIAENVGYGGAFCWARS